MVIHSKTGQQKQSCEAIAPSNHVNSKKCATGGEIMMHGLHQCCNVGSEKHNASHPISAG